MSKDHETPTPTSSTQCSAPSSGEHATSTTSKGFREPLGDNAVEQLRHYQSMTIPPSARRALMAAELPRASPELLYDTLPPNLVVQHGAGDTALEAETEAALPSARKRNLRGLVVAIAAVMLALLFAAWMARPGEPQPQAAAVQPPPPASGIHVSTTPPTPAATSDEAADAKATHVSAGRASAAVELGLTSETPKPTLAEKKSATGLRPAPTRMLSRAATSPAASPPVTEPATVSPPPSDGPPAKKFRLGSR